ncbi:MBL fold metallo-hydrolase [Nocardioides koreensis]|uniref:MBL fold metallo-hydrolase n=1 Tax=Nocardioides koreensis TaxID=433651 RepID=A0ABN2ZC39_9ACTN
MTGSLSFTWWGHASTTVELDGVRVAVDPLLVDRLLHLRRYAVSPAPRAAVADVVLISHPHADHCHLPSLRLFDRGTTVVAPPGAAELVGRLGFEHVVVAVPGAGLRLATSQDTTIEVEVLGATHDGRRLPLPRATGTAVGFRVAAAGRSFWFPGDTGLREDMWDVDPVDLALAPVGGWGPTLGAGHMDPVEAAEAVDRVGADWAVPVHWGTFWPVGLGRVDRRRHQHLFVTPGQRFTEAVGDASRTVLPAPGERVELHG